MNQYLLYFVILVDYWLFWLYVHILSYNPQPLQQPHDIFFMFRSNNNQTLLALEIQK